MKFKPTQLVYVYYKPKNTKILMGRLLLKTRKIFFEYDPTFITTGLNLSPFKLPLKPGVITSQDHTFNGLFGVFNDSLPDGWGHLLLDRKLKKHGLNAQSLSPLDRLCFVGQQSMGALLYEPSHKENIPSPSTDIDLDTLSSKTQAFQNNNDDRFVEDLLRLNRSSAGARPKALLNLKGQHWIIKFRSSIDPKDIGNIEYAYHLMAQAAQIDLPKAKLFQSKKGGGFFGTKRFDRTEHQSLHMHTISGLLHTDHRIPSLDYETLIKATLHLTHDIRECEKQFRLSVFNVLSHNRDDHAKNFSFLMDNDGIWRVSPAYDLTFSSGPNGEHCSMIMGEGKNPGLAHLLKLATICNIPRNKASAIIDEVKSAVNQWHLFADAAKVSINSKTIVASTIKKILKENF